MSLKNLFQKSRKVSNNFETIDAKVIREHPEILKLVRLSLNMSIAEFSKKFEMHQQSRFEKRITKPSRATIERFMKRFSNYRKYCNFELETLQKRNEAFMWKHKGGISVGRKTLFKQNDARTRELSIKGARKGGISTVRTHGPNHMAKLAKRIQRGRVNNSGFRSKAEMMVGNALESLGIKYEYEVPLNGYLPDFKIGRTLVEVMCTSTPEYWNKQAIKIAKLSQHYKMIIVTNRPEKILKQFESVEVVKFSKYFGVLRNRIGEKLKT